MALKSQLDQLEVARAEFEARVNETEDTLLAHAAAELAIVLCRGKRSTFLPDLRQRFETAPETARPADLLNDEEREMLPSAEFIVTSIYTACQLDRHLAGKERPHIVSDAVTAGKI